jgi:3-methyl-2-oxobutanoate hydroxymethyltransferase
VRGRSICISRSLVIPFYTQIYMSDEEKQSSLSKPSDSGDEKPKPKRRAPVRRKKSTSPNAKKAEEATAEKAVPEVAPAVNQKPEKSEPEQKSEESSSKPQPQPKLSTKPNEEEGKTEDGPKPSARSQRQPNRKPQEHPTKYYEDQARNVRDIANLKGKRPIVALTAYDAVMGRLVNDAGVDFILVGDSVGTTLLGHRTTIPVDMTDMVRHTAAVRRAQPKCLLVADLPFGEASFSFDRLLESARRLMQEGGADAVKIEGGRDVADDIEKLVATGVPVLGHIGLLPQTVKAIGGYRKFGIDRQEAEDLYTDAIALEEAGCFAVVGEMIEEAVARELTKQILPPLIGIGSGAGCDGQILVSTDILGYNTRKAPSFVKTYANLNQVITRALSQYVEEVRGGKFPS